jgi:hypothetical protein
VPRSAHFLELSHGGIRDMLVLEQFDPDDNLRGAEYAGVRAHPYSRLVFFQM